MGFCDRETYPIILDSEYLRSVIWPYSRATLCAFKIEDVDYLCLKDKLKISE